MKDYRWICIKCSWNGIYKETEPVMYRGVNWQKCPSCGSVSIPICGSDWQPLNKEVEHEQAKCVFLPGCKLKISRGGCLEKCEAFSPPVG